MDTKVKNKLTRLAQQCEDLAQEIRSVLSETDSPEKQERKTKAESTSQQLEAETLIQELKNGTREHAEKKLMEMKQKDVGILYRQMGGLSSDAKKKKDFVIGRILWELFDFQKGHDILRNS